MLLPEPVGKLAIERYSFEPVTHVLPNNRLPLPRGYLDGVEVVRAEENTSQLCHRGSHRRLTRRKLLRTLDRPSEIALVKQRPANGWPLVTARKAWRSPLMNEVPDVTATLR